MEKGRNAPEEQFLLLSTVFCYLMLDFCVKTKIRFSLRDKRLFEITEVEITRVDCIIVDIYLFIDCFISESMLVIPEGLNGVCRHSGLGKK